MERAPTSQQSVRGPDGGEYAVLLDQAALAAERYKRREDAKDVEVNMMVEDARWEIKDAKRRAWEAKVQVRHKHQGLAPAGGGWLVEGVVNGRRCHYRNQGHTGAFTGWEKPIGPGSARPPDWDCRGIDPVPAAHRGSQAPQGRGLQV